MAQEIERKFLVTGSYKELATQADRIVQGYICSAHGRTVRVRIRGGRGTLSEGIGLRRKAEIKIIKE